MVTRPAIKGIYLLPNLFTTAALFAGFYAIVAAIGAEFVHAAIAVLIAGLLDGLDGRIARLTRTQSSFGVQYDSLADLISFGVAPAVIVYLWALEPLQSIGPFWDKLGWLAAFVYAACAALRLARFNSQAGVADKRYFQGLASPAAAGVLVTMVWVVETYQLPRGPLAFPALGVLVAVALLMVSQFRYVSFKSWPLSERVPFARILALLLIFVLLAIETPTVLFVLGVGYVISGPVLTLAGRRRRLGLRRRLDWRRRENPEGDTSGGGDD